jgi:heterogeneous nuclear ribonucleoprotein F/H
MHLVIAIAIAQQHLKEQEGRPQLSSANSADDLGAADEEQSGEAASADLAALWGHSTGSPPMQGYGELGLMGHHGAPPGVAMTGRSGAGPAGGLHAPLLKRTGGGIQVGDHTGFLRMRGLPFSAAKEDIYKFFESYNPILESIVLTYRNDGRATGEAYIGFATGEDSKRAMDLHRKSMGNRYIELFISNKDEQGRALARFGNR